MNNDKKVLVTGITGFIGSHTAIQLLKKGYPVTGTLRDMKRAAAIKKMIGQHSPATHKLTIIQADLLDPSIWEKLLTGVDYVQHIASPFPTKIPKDENELIRPAKEGILNILAGAAKCRVKRVVLTSSGGAVTYGQPKERRSRIFDETDWTDENRKDDITSYFKSKTLAEKAAWNFMQTNRSDLELSVVCPGLVLGPLLEEDFSASANVILKLMDGSLPAVPKIGYDIVDVRSIASLLILAMEKPIAANQRYLGAAGFLHFNEIAAILKEAYPKKKIPSLTLPDWLVHVLSIFDATVKPVLTDLGTERKMNHLKAVNELGWEPVTPQEAILSSAASIIRLGLVK